MKALQILAASGLIAAVTAPAASIAASPSAASAMMPKISPQVMATVQKAAAAMATVTSGRTDLTIAGTPLVTHLTFTKTPLAADIQTTVGKLPFTESIAIDGMFYQRLGNGTYGATRFTNIANLVRTLIITQLAMTPMKHVAMYDPKKYGPIKPVTVTERDITEDGLAVAQLKMSAYVPTAMLQPTAASRAASAKTTTPATLICSFAKGSGLPHRCAIGFAGTTFVTLAFSGWNDPANVVTAPAGVATPPPDAPLMSPSMPMVTPMPTMLPSTVHAPGAGA